MSGRRIKQKESKGSNQSTIRKLLVIGCFTDKSGRLDGQIVKTRDIYAMLEDRLPKDDMLRKFNTLDVGTNPFLLLRLLSLLLWCNTAILIPANRNLTVFFPFMYILSKIANYKVIQLCVGGWQVDYFLGRGKWAAHPKQMKLSTKCAAFLPEIEKVRTGLIEKCGFTPNMCEVFPNFRRIVPDIDHVNDTEELKIVWLARIKKGKGYETVFNLAKKIEDEHLKISITFYGMIEDGREYFTDLLEKHNNVVDYRGQLDSDKIAVTLCDYDVMVLPTQFYTEGFPGTVLDAYISGLPVVVTEWMHSREFVEDGVSGFIVPFNNPQEEFDKRLLLLYNDRELLRRMKRNAREHAMLYTQDKAWDVLKKYL